MYNYVESFIFTEFIITIIMGITTIMVIIILIIIKIKAWVM